VKKLLLFLIFSFFINSSTSIAQHFIKGKIIDSLSENPVEYASVSLFHTKDSTLVTGQLVDSKGLFTLMTLNRMTIFQKSNSSVIGLK